MTPTWDYVQARIADQQASAERRRRVAASRARRGGPRLTSFLRVRGGRAEETGGCRE